MNILVVDDDPLAGELAAAALEDAGHRCVLAENAIEALERLAEEPSLDLVVSDLNMPLVSGLDLFREIGQQGLKLPFILLTGEDPEPIRAREPGLAGALAKDARLELSLPALAAALGT